MRVVFTGNQVLIDLLIVKLAKFKDDQSHSCARLAITLWTKYLL